MSDTGPVERRHLLTVALVVLVVLAGCSSFGAADGAGGESPESPAVPDSVTGSLDNATTDRFERALTGENGTLTDEGETLLRQLDEIAQLGTDQRDAVVERVASSGTVDAETIDTIDRLLDSPVQFQRTVFRAGLADANGDGLLDGEAIALGVDPNATNPRLADVASLLAPGGYTETDLSFLERLATFSQKEWVQAREFELLEAVESGSVGDEELWAIGDTAGDGLLNGMARRLELDPAQSHQQIAGYADRLSTGGYEETDRTFLDRVAHFSEFQWQQFSGLGLETVLADGTVTDDELAGIADESGDGLLTAAEEELGLDPSTSNPAVAEVARQLGRDSFAGLGAEYLGRLGTVESSEFSQEQAAYVGGIDPLEDGQLTEADLWAIEDRDGDGLLNAMEETLGVEVAEQNPDVVTVAEPLSQGGYDQTGVLYLERVAELANYTGNEYEVWAQAGQLGLLEAATRNGTVTESQLWGIRNNDSDRLVNAMEVEFGTDPEKADTSGDGYPDHLKWGPLRDIGLAVNPGEPDIYLEIDTTDGVSSPGETQQDAIQSTFAEEPSDETGRINVHFRVCDSDQESVSTADEMEDIAPDAKNITGLGFHYLLLTDGRITVGGDVAQGLAFTPVDRPSWMVVDGTIASRQDGVYQAAVIAHELGHSLGLANRDFDGIDSTRYDYDEYTSVMNYNMDRSEVTFSTGDPFNDYEHVKDEEYGSNHQNRDALETMWEAGNASEDALC